MAHDSAILESETGSSPVDHYPQQPKLRRPRQAEQKARNRTDVFSSTGLAIPIHARRSRPDAPEEARLLHPQRPGSHPAGPSGPKRPGTFCLKMSQSHQEEKPEVGSKRKGRGRKAGRKKKEEVEAALVPTLFQRQYWKLIRGEFHSTCSQFFSFLFFYLIAKCLRRELLLTLTLSS